MPHIVCVVGARPNFMKMAPAIRALCAYPGFRITLVHTAQHYDLNMSDVFFSELQMPAPDYRLEVGAGTQAGQTARIMERMEPVFSNGRPDVVLVAGDVNSTLAAALVAAKMSIPIAHIEAGLRSYDRRMPEEINRVLVDQISDLLYTTEREAFCNLCREGIDEERIVFVGNLMIDTLLASLKHAVPAKIQIAGRYKLIDVKRVEKGYAVLTLHRPSNVDDPIVLAGILDAVAVLAKQLPVVFPVHPRTAASIAELGSPYNELEGVLTIPPVGYFEMVGLIKDTKLVLTDSGGLQEETTALGVPCLTLRENTERPITVREGTNIVVGVQVERVLTAAESILRKGGVQARIPEGWDGAAAIRLASHLNAWLSERQAIASSARSSVCELKSGMRPHAVVH